MAKRVMTYQLDKKGKPIIVPAFKPTRAQKQSQTPMSFTPGPKTRGQKIARALWD